MEAPEQAVTRDFVVEIVRYAKTNLLMAFSNDLPGLLVPAQSEEQLDQRLARAVREILEAQGATDISVSIHSATKRASAGTVEVQSACVVAASSQGTLIMTPDGYRAVIRSLGLTPCRPSLEGRTLHRTRDGDLQHVPDPEPLFSEERKAIIASIKFRLGIVPH